MQNDRFKVDTHRPRSRSKMRSKLRHILAVASGMFPLMALFIYLMSWFQLPELRKSHRLLALVFVGCGMVTLLFYAWARAEKLRRREVSSRNRSLKYQARENAFIREQEDLESRQTAATAKGG